MLVKIKSSFLLLVLSLAMSGVCVAANTISGRVMNQTSAKAASGDQIILLRLGEGMQEAERTHTDANGAFSFATNSADADYVVRVVHQNVNYDQKLSGAPLPLEIAVYDVVPKIPGLAGTMGIAQVESDAANLKVTEMYAISNVSNPPVTQANAHNFEISLPAGAKLESLQVKRAGGVWVNAASTQNTGSKGRYSVDYPLRPGDTLFKFVYHLPYQSGTSLKVHLAYPVRNFGVVHPPSIGFKSSQPQMFSSPGVIKGLQLEQLVSDGMIREVPAFRLSGMGAAPSQSDVARETPQPAKPTLKVTGTSDRAQNTPPEQGNDGKNGVPWAVAIAMAVLLMAGILLMVWRRKRSSVFRPGRNDGDEMSTASALRDELSQLETEKLYGAISSDEYEVAKQALNVSLERALARTHN